MSSKQPNQTTVDLLVHPIGELVTPIADRGPIHGLDMAKIACIKNGALAVVGGKIVACGPEREVLEQIVVGPNTRVVSAQEKLVTPGLVDPHTHLIFAGNRANEFLMRCQGKTYTEIAQAGGGIVASMKATRAASVKELVDLALPRLSRMLNAGTTTCEVKTGYGLDLDSELRMLLAILELNQRQPVELVPTFMPAHAVPTGVDHELYVNQVIEVMLPAVADLCQRLNAPLPFNDIFCDQGYFTLEDTKRILMAGKSLGLKPKVHADEFVNLGATSLAVDLGAASADHLLNISQEEITKLAASNTVAVLLPGTSFYLNLAEHAPARKLIEAGAAVALGSDFNPGSCHIFSLPFILGLACLHLKMTPQEALTALTVNAAHAIGKGEQIGQLKSGFQADFVIFDLPTLFEIPYNLGWNPTIMTFKHGQQVAG